MRLLSCVSAVGLIALASATPAAADVVAIGSELSPEVVRIAAGQTVRWENGTPALQRIDSTGSPEFDDLDVPAGGSGERRFTRTGRYRYAVPGTGKAGEVRVVARAARRPRSRGRGCGRRDVFLYDVTVTATKSMSEFWLPQYQNDGQFAIDYAYRARYNDVPVVIARQCGAGATIGRSGRRHAGSGTLTNYRWSDSVQNPEFPEDRPPCGFNASTAGLGAQIEIEGFAARTGSFLGIATRLRDDQNDALHTMLTARRAAVCDKGNLTNGNVLDGLPGHDAAGGVPIFRNPYRVAGGKLDPPAINLFGQFATTRSAGPVTAIARGRSFAISSGPRRYQGVNTQTNATASASLRISFKRRR